jgi:glycosyltransferase involved in cell wall biosynthesis
MAAPLATSVIVPAYNEAGAVGNVVSGLVAVGPWHEILVIDDGSTDATGEAARASGAVVIRHPYRKGNGAAVKTGVRAATGEFILIIDGDGQHRTEDSVKFVTRLAEYDLVVGARSGSTQATQSRRMGNSILNWLASYLAGHPIPDLTSGFRATRRAALMEFLHLMPNGFSTATTTTLAFIKAGYSVAFEPTAARPRAGASKIRLVSDGAKFFQIVMRVITIYSPLRIFAPVSLAALALGAGYGIWTIFTQSRVTNSAVLLITLGVLIFLIGLISEQISALRFEGRQR